MPGLIDGHCHISYGDILSFEELDLHAGVEYRTLRAANNARKVLRAGVTAFSDPGSTFAALCNTRDEMVTEARREIKDGVDIVKVAGDGDSLTGEAELAGSIGLDDLRAIAEVTHRLGKVCTIHARSGRAEGITIIADTDSGQGSVPYGEWHAREQQAGLDAAGAPRRRRGVAGRSVNPAGTPGAGTRAAGRRARPPGSRNSPRRPSGRRGRNSPLRG